MTPFGETPQPGKVPPPTLEAAENAGPGVGVGVGVGVGTASGGAIAGKEGDKNEVANSKPKEIVEDIRKAPGYDELDEEDKKLCEELGLLPRPYEAFKKKLINKALKTRNAIRRAHALEFVDKYVTKPKAYAVFDSLATRNLLPNLK